MLFYLPILIGLWTVHFEDTSKHQPKQTATKLEIITTLPHEVDGCSECYATDNASLTHGQFIAVTNHANIGFIRVNGKLLKLRKTSGKTGFSDANNIVYRGHGYEIVIRTKVRRISDEEYSEKGFIEIRHGVLKQTIKVVG